MKPKCHVTTRQHDNYIRVTHLCDKHRTARTTVRHTLRTHYRLVCTCMRRKKHDSETVTQHQNLAE